MPKPGERLPTEGELAKTYGFSRSVIRDAMRTLAARCLVDVRHGHGTVVTEPNDTAVSDALVVVLMRSQMTIGDVLRARAAIETELLGPLAAKRATEGDLLEMGELLVRFERAVDERDWKRAHREDFGFHVSLFHAIHLPALEIVLRPMHQIILLSSLPAQIDNAESWKVQVHYPILEALREHDEDAARTAVREHFRFMEDTRYHGYHELPFRQAPAIEELLENQQEVTLDLGSLV